MFFEHKYKSFMNNASEFTIKCYLVLVSIGCYTHVYSAPKESPHPYHFNEIEN